MGCGCKDKTIKIEDKVEIPMLRKIINVVSMSLFIIIISPIIFIVIWVMGINSAIGGNYNPIISIAKSLSNKKEDKDEISEDFNPNDYELLDVEVIK